MRKVEMFDETWLTIKFILEEYMEFHQVYKWDIDLATLQTYIPIVKIHAGGLIEFTRNRFALLVDFVPTTNPEMDLESHYLNIQAIHNRLVKGMTLKWISLSKFGAPAMILNKLEKQMKNPKTTKKEFALIESQYKKIKKGKITPDWEFTAFLGLGEFEGPHEYTTFVGRIFIRIRNRFLKIFKVREETDTRTPLERARERMENELPTLLEGMADAQMRIDLLTEKEVIVKKLIKHLIPRDQ